MGVLKCDRKGCDNVMCNRRSSQHGYICDSCFEELVERLVWQGSNINIGEFMEAEKGGLSLEEEKELARQRAKKMFPRMD